MEGHGLEVPQMLREFVSFNSYFHILPRCLGLTLFGTQTFLFEIYPSGRVIKQKC